MAASVRLDISISPIVTEVLATGVDGASSPSITFQDFAVASTLDSTTTPPVSKNVSKSFALTAGAATIDLTTVTGVGGESRDGSALRVQAIYLENPSTNAGTMTFAKGASNGYDGFGSAFSLVLAPGGAACIVTNDGGTNIGASNKTIDIAGTGTESFNATIVMG